MDNNNLNIPKKAPTQPKPVNAPPKIPNKNLDGALNTQNKSMPIKTGNQPPVRKTPENKQVDVNNISISDDEALNKQNLLDAKKKEEERLKLEAEKEQQRIQAEKLKQEEEKFLEAKKLQQQQIEKALEEQRQRNQEKLQLLEDEKQRQKLLEDEQQKELEIKRQQEELILKQEKEIKDKEKAEQKALNKQIRKENKERRKARNKVLFSKKLFLVPFCLIIYLCLGAIAVGVSFVVDFTTKLETPKFLIYSNNIGTYLKIEEEMLTTKYEIVITDSLGNETKVTEKDSFVNIGKHFKQAGLFNVKVKALGKTDWADSDFSEEVEVANYQKLACPVVSINQAGNNLISWNPIANATGYKLYYKANLAEDLVEYFDIEQSDKLITFDKTLINDNGLGNYYVSVVALGDKENYYLDSDFSTIKNYTNTQKADLPHSAEYLKDSKTLKITTVNQAVYKNYVLKVVNASGQKDVMISLLGLAPIVENVSGVNYYSYFVDLSTVNLTNYNSLSLITCGDGEYIINSDELSV